MEVEEGLGRRQHVRLTPNTDRTPTFAHESHPQLVVIYGVSLAVQQAKRILELIEELRQ